VKFRVTSIVAACPYTPSGVVVVTLVIAGRMPSTTKLRMSARFMPAGIMMLQSLPEASRRVPPREMFDTFRSWLAWPEAIVYVPVAVIELLNAFIVTVAPANESRSRTS